MTKLCANCKRDLPADAFYLERSRRRLSSWCRECSKQRQREQYQRQKDDPEYKAYHRAAQRLWATRKNPGAARAIRERWRAKVKDDPEFRAKQAAYRRAYNERHRERVLQDARIRAGEKVKHITTAEGAYKRKAGKAGSVDPTPFIDYLRARFPGQSWDYIARYEMRGVLPERRLRGWAEYGERASFDAIDRAVTLGLDDPWLLNELYPLDDEDVAA